VPCRACAMTNRPLSPRPADSGSSQSRAEPSIVLIIKQTGDDRPGSERSDGWKGDARFFSDLRQPPYRSVRRQGVQRRLCWWSVRFRWDCHPSIQRIHCIPPVDLAVHLCAWHRRGLQMLPARGVLRRTVMFRQMRVRDTVPRPAVGGPPRKSSHIVPPACLSRAGICSPEGYVSILRARMDWQA
jgi:hypothetical protein